MNDSKLPLEVRMGILKTFSPNIKKADNTSSSSGQHWITVNGKHVLLSGKGDVLSGNLKGKGGEDVKKIGSKNGAGYQDRKVDYSATIHENSEAIAKHAGISHKEYQSMHPGTKKELAQNYHKDLKSASEEGKEHKGTFEKVKEGKIKSQKDLGQSIKNDHNKEDFANVPNGTNYIKGKFQEKFGKNAKIKVKPIPDEEATEVIVDGKVYRMQAGSDDDNWAFVNKQDKNDVVEFDFENDEDLETGDDDNYSSKQEKQMDGRDKNPFIKNSNK